MKTYAYGFPRIGRGREFKKNVEAYWSGCLKEKELVKAMYRLEEERLLGYQKHVDIFPLGEFTYYDNMLDTALMFGVYKAKDLDDYFAYGRGKKALEMKKYFNTNYHYLVPVIKRDQKFKVSWNKPMAYFRRFKDKDKPISIIGPYTFLKLSRVEGNFEKTFNDICGAYGELFKRLEGEGVKAIHLEEPAFCLDVPGADVTSIVRNFKRMISEGPGISLITYYGSVDFLKELYDVPFSGLGLDLVAGKDNLDNLRKCGFPSGRHLICGVVDGRDVRRSDIEAKVRLVKDIKKAAGTGDENILVSNSAPLFHLPVSTILENGLKRSHRDLLSFALERMHELGLIKKAFYGDKKEATEWSEAVAGTKIRRTEGIFDTASLPEKVYDKRKKLQAKELALPLFPTTTIGSFPQDAEVRKMRMGYRKGQIGAGEYRDFLKGRIRELVRKEEDLGLDVIVHGEFERTDMVEFFAQKLEGFLTTSNGWVISYGTRAYRPPIVMDKIYRKVPLTLRETLYAGKLTDRPVKGIFTGPVTILAWGFCVRTEPISTVAFELARALNEEARDLVSKGVKIIQVDEPAIKEFCPIKKRKEDAYFSWAIRSFNLTTRLPEKVQVHTHLCYSEFSTIIDRILKMNFDVITIETAREKGKVLNVFAKAGFRRQIGPGLWDIHSKYPANNATIRRILDKGIELFGAENIWMNPDCGLKTRGWEEVEVSLDKICSLAREYRKNTKYAKNG
ncbi:MAG: 5-methyltetrahydropteroyltriglutamate--homocysteine S-methyltransferase [Candidatus Omnitrophica bacterium]|nr:5-methyltetrahydropteroyltriglutamate--homocysteine S-methyltransferase [Candidatus Omnitrophota bacterium]